VNILLYLYYYIMQKHSKKKNNKLSRKFKIKVGGKICNEIQITKEKWRSQHSVLFHDNGNLLLTHNIIDKDVTFWNMSSDLSPENCKPSVIIHKSEVVSIMFKGIENLLYTCSNYEITIWSFNPDGSNLTRLQTNNNIYRFMFIESMAVHPILPVLLIGDGSDEARLYSLYPDGRMANLMSIVEGHGDGVSAVAFHPQLPFFATGSSNGNLNLGCLTSNGSQMISVTPFDELSILYVQSIVFHPTDNIFGTSNSVGFKLWAFSSDCTIINNIINLPIGMISSIAFHPTGNYLATTSTQKLELWHLLKQNDELTLHLSETMEGQTMDNTNVAFHPSGKLLSTSNFLWPSDITSTAKLWDCSKLSTEWQIKQGVKHGMTKKLVQELAKDFTPQNHMFSRTGNVADVSWNRRNKDKITSVKYQTVGQRRPITNGKEPVEETEEETERPEEEPEQHEEANGGAKSRRNYKKKISRRIRRSSN